MDKLDAVHLLGHKFVTEMCRELGISPNTWYRYSDPLPNKVRREIVGIANERDIEVAERFLK